MQVRLSSWPRICRSVVAVVMLTGCAYPQITVPWGTCLECGFGRPGFLENYERVAALHKQAIIAHSSKGSPPTVCLQQTILFTGSYADGIGWGQTLDSPIPPVFHADCRILASCGMVAGQFYSNTSPKVIFPKVGIFFMTAQAAISQSDQLAPGRVTLAIMTMGVKPGFVTNTAAIPSVRGKGCIVDASPSYPSDVQNIEMTNYAVVDGNHLSFILTRPHVSGATVFIGDGCRYEPQTTSDDH